MISRSTLKRTGFKRRELPKPRVLALRVSPGQWRAGAASTPALCPAQPKHSYVRSKKLREAYRLIPCQHCGCADGTVCCAHSNWATHGKGAGIKADDSRGASLCAACHVPLLDQGAALTRAQRRALWWAAHIKSVRLLVEIGAWPKAIPVPDTSTFPWGEQDDDNKEINNPPRF